MSTNPFTQTFSQENKSDQPGGTGSKTLFGSNLSFNTQTNPTTSGMNLNAKPDEKPQSNVTSNNFSNVNSLTKFASFGPNNEQANTKTQTDPKSSTGFNTGGLPSVNPSLFANQPNNNKAFTTITSNNKEGEVSKTHFGNPPNFGLNNQEKKTDEQNKIGTSEHKFSFTGITSNQDKKDAPQFGSTNNQTNGDNKYVFNSKTLNIPGTCPDTTEKKDTASTFKPQEKKEGGSLFGAPTNTSTAPFTNTGTKQEGIFGTSGATSTGAKPGEMFSNSISTSSGTSQGGLFASIASNTASGSSTDNKKGGILFGANPTQQEKKDGVSSTNLPTGQLNQEKKEPGFGSNTSNPISFGNQPKKELGNLTSNTNTGGGNKDEKKEGTSLFGSKPNTLTAQGTTSTSGPSETTSTTGIKFGTGPTTFGAATNTVSLGAGMTTSTNTKEDTSKAAGLFNAAKDQSKTETTKPETKPEAKDLFSKQEKKDESKIFLVTL